MGQKIDLKKPCYNSFMTKRQCEAVMNIDGLSVVETIEAVRNAMPKENLSSAFIKNLEELLLLASIMKDRLSTNSGNSSKPPSKDELKDKASETTDKPKPGSRKKPGGQAGHQGTQLKMIEDPDEIIYIRHDSNIDLDGTYTFTDYETRQVIDLKISRHVIEYRAEVITDEQGNKLCASFPVGVGRPVQYGVSLKSHAVYMSQFQLIPYDRVTQQLTDNTEITLSAGSIYNFNREAYESLAKFEGWIIKTQTNAKVLHADETGININGKNHWLHSLSNDVSTYFHADAKRGSTAMDAMEVLPDFRGVLCHDHWKPYYKYQCVHALCNAHHLRELKRAYEQDNQQWAKEIETLLLEMNTAAKQSDTGILTEDEINAYEKRYLEILEKGKNECPETIVESSNKKGKTKRTRARNLLNRLINFMQDTLRFAKEAEVPFTNNNAEREIRMTKVHQKVSGCFRSMKGAEMFCLIRSYLITSRKHGINPVDALRMLFNGEKPAYMNS